MSIYWDFGTGHKAPDWFFLANHNLATFDAAGTLGIWLCGSNSPPVAGVWSGATFKVDISGSINRECICHRPNVGTNTTNPTNHSYQYWGVYISYTGTTLTDKLFIGRMLFLGNESTDYWQPQNNPQYNIRRVYEDASIVHETEDQSFEALEKQKRNVYDLTMSFHERADHHAFYEIFNSLGRSDDAFFCLAPSEVPTETTDHTGSAFLFSYYVHPPMMVQITGSYDWTGAANDLGTYRLRLRQIVGGSLTRGWYAS